MASFIQKYQLKRVSLLIFMMWLSQEVYLQVIDLVREGSITSDLMAAALLFPLSFMFPAVLKYMQEEQ